MAAVRCRSGSVGGFLELLPSCPCCGVMHVVLGRGPFAGHERRDCVLGSPASLQNGSWNSKDPVFLCVRSAFVSLSPALKHKSVELAGERIKSGKRFFIQHRGNKRQKTVFPSLPVFGQYWQLCIESSCEQLQWNTHYQVEGYPASPLWGGNKQSQVMANRRSRYILTLHLTNDMSMKEGIKYHGCSHISLILCFSQNRKAELLDSQR